MQSAFEFTPRTRYGTRPAPGSCTSDWIRKRGPFNPPSSLKGCYTPTARSVKAYVVDVPVYAAPEGTTQEDWNNVSHSFTITDTNGVVKTYEVSQNMANPATARAKIYPAT